MRSQLGCIVAKVCRLGKRIDCIKILSIFSDTLASLALIIVTDRLIYRNWKLAISQALPQSVLILMISSDDQYHIDIDIDIYNNDYMIN